VHERLVEVLVKEDLRDLIIELKGDLTYDAFLRNLLNPSSIKEKEKKKQ